jgi:hypothetical protein
MSKTHITPSIGRIVWFYPSTRMGSSDFHPPTLSDPLAAIVAKVIGAATLNLTVFDAQGVSHAMTGVPLVQEGEDVPADGYYAEWMPYQIGQAKKAEDREHDAKQLAVAAAPSSTDNRGLRAHALEMALRTPGAQHHTEVLAAAKAYQAHIDGTTAAMTQQPAPGAAYPGYSTMQLHQQRVVDEKTELDVRLAKLIPFLDTAIFAGLDEAEQSRLRQQSHAMACYSAILGERIDAFAPAASALPGSVIDQMGR